MRAISRTVTGCLMMLVAASGVQADELLPLEVGPLTIGGAVRFNLQYDDWGSDQGAIGDADWDTFRVNLDLKAGDVIGSAEYRYYPYNNSSYYHFLHHAWLGYRLGENTEVQAGVHQVPFGIQPYASHNFWFGMPYYVGFEDDYDLGIKMIQSNGPWTYKLAYYAMDEGNYHDDWTEDAARYSFDVVNADGVNNEERNQVNGRVTYDLEHGENAVSELGASVEYGQIHNRDTDDDGDHYAGALHLNGNYGRWNVMAEAIRFEYDLENPADQNDELVKMGAFGSVFDVVTEGTLLVANLAYTLPVELGSIKSLTFYNDYSVLMKDESDYNDSELNTVGMSFGAGRFYTYVDVICGRNAPWLNSTAPLAEGTTDEWATRFNINVGYYF